MLSFSPKTDRFIPSRLKPVSFSQSQPVSQYENLIHSSLYSQPKPLDFTQDSQNIDPNYSSSIFSSCCKNSKSFVKVCEEAEKVLEAPSIRDDFYLNLLDWSWLGQLGIALDDELFLYTPQNTTQISKRLDGSYISSVKFCGKNPLVSVGYSDGKIHIYDLERLSLVRELWDHQKRVSCQDYEDKRNILLTGSKDKNIFAHDLALKNSIVSVHQGHRGEICSLKTEQTQGRYFASGSNDNHVRIWDNRREGESIIKNKDHRGAVKALDWCPWKNGVIASGGGSGDKTIRIWSALEQEPICMKKTDTQISSLVWNQKLNNLYSSHGCPRNQIIQWQPIPNGERAMTLREAGVMKGHKSRILQMIKSPNEGFLCSISSDETIRLWKTQEGGNPWASMKDQNESRWSFKLK